MTVNIVHLSDLQAGEACLAELKTEGLETCEPKVRYQHYAEVLAQDVQQCLSNLPSQQVNLLAITGDIANKAREQEYENATVFLEAFVGTFAEGLMPWGNLTVVPGNHDVDWTALSDRYGPEPQTEDEAEKCAGIKEKMDNFANWINSLYESHGVQYRYEFGTAKRFSDIAQDQLTVVGLDSCESLTHNNKLNHGYIGHDQLKQAEGYLNDSEVAPIKVAILHHNPFAHEGDDNPSGLHKPTRVLLGLAGAGARLILAGHMHRPRFEVSPAAKTGTESICYVLVSGPCCMRHEERELKVGEHSEVLPNRYQIISIDPKTLFVAVNMRRLSFERWSGPGPLGDWTVDTDPQYGDGGEFGFYLDPTLETMRKEWIDAFGQLPEEFRGLF